MRKLLLGLTLLLAGCAGAGGKLTLGMRNTTSVPIAIVATYGGVFSRTIILYPGQTWDGWLPYIDAPGSVKVEIRPYSPVP